MAILTLDTKRLKVRADVPEALARGVRAISSRVRAERVSDPRLGELEISPWVPPVNLLPRDAELGAADVTKLRKPPSERASLAEQVAAIDWYHVIELPGDVVTPGAFDHRRLAPLYGIPDIKGKRVLDANTFDGFWAFEFERRGADVVANDLAAFADADFPPPVKEIILSTAVSRSPGLGFHIAHKALGSTVQRSTCNIYDFDPEHMGTFDLVHVGDLLLHLESPIRAMRAVRSVTSGHALFVDCFDPQLSGRHATAYYGGWEHCVWWMPSLDMLVQMIHDAGFSDVKIQSIYRTAGVNESLNDALWRASILATA